MTVESHNFKGKGTAVCLIGAIRTDYFRQVVDSLASQVGDRAVYAFLDVPPDGNRIYQDEQEGYFLNSIPNGHVVRQESHCGLGKQMIFARQYAFDYKKHKRAFVLEDDLVLSEGYLDFCENLMDWTDRNYDNVGIVQGWSERGHNLANSSGIGPFEVAACYDHFWGYLINQDCWQKIKPLLEVYLYTFLYDIPIYAHRDHRGIMQWKGNVIQSMQGVREIYKEHNKMPFLDDDKIGREKTCSTVTGQDAVTLMSTYMNNIVRVAPVLGRGTYIGVDGEHYNRSIFDNFGFNDWTEYSTRDDATNKEFSRANYSQIGIDVQ